MKILYLVRGLPGSGKSTLARQLTSFNVAADDFMVDAEGKYSFNADRLGYCHKSCQNQVEQWMKESQSVIAVHNTFSTNREMRVEQMNLVCFIHPSFALGTLRSQEN